MGQRFAGTPLEAFPVSGLRDVRYVPGRPTLLRVKTIEPNEIQVGQLSVAAGRSVLATLDHAVRAAREGVIDALVFAPLNKQAMKRAGLKHSEEMHYFAELLGYHGYFGELNVLDDLWLARVTSHIPLKEVAANLTAEGIGEAARLIDRSLREYGVARPRIVVSALNPHAGEGGMFGSEEIDTIRPAVERLRAQGLDIAGPVPADTVFIAARRGDYDAIVSMYHDQGQIAMKLLGFEGGVTVQGGLPIPIVTPAHGTAFDIAGKGVANPESIRRAFRIAANMASRRGNGPDRRVTSA
jgi:4-hydroxythreonine-4-phosphate dehydrogenase